MKIFSGSHGSMPSTFRRPDRLSADDAAAERLLSGRGADPDAPAGQRTLELVLEAAARTATERELSGEEAAVAAFLIAAGALGRRPWAGDRVRTRARTGARSLRHKLVLAAIGCVLAAAGVLGGAAAAGGLPAPLQKVAHTVFDAPGPPPVAPPSGGHGRTGPRTPSPGATASGPPPGTGIGARALAADWTRGHDRPGMARPARGWDGHGQGPWHGWGRSRGGNHGSGSSGAWGHGAGRGKISGASQGGGGQGWRSARSPRAASSGTAGPTRS